MNAVICYGKQLREETSRAWNRFWFTPADPATLGVIRALTGAMLFYTHAVWAVHSQEFFGETSWLPSSAIAELQPNSYATSVFNVVDSPAGLWCLHAAALLTFALLTLGLFTRTVAVFAFFWTLAYVHRAGGALFGLDQVNAMLVMYLMLAPCGQFFSLDSYFGRRRGKNGDLGVTRTVSANIATRLIQVHMCVIYFFAAIAKLQGPAWWNGTAVWGAIANLEYQSLDLTALAAWPLTVNMLTHAAVAWELSYCVLVWNRLLRPLVLLGAVLVHTGIGLCLGMLTFGSIMLVGNLAFVSPTTIRAIVKFRRHKQRLQHAPTTTCGPTFVRSPTTKKNARKSMTSERFTDG